MRGGNGCIAVHEESRDSCMAVCGGGRFGVVAVTEVVVLLHA